MKDFILNLVPSLSNTRTRDGWVAKRLSEIPKGQTMLDAGAGECKYKRWCAHLQYTSQDFSQYDGKGDGVGLQTKTWDVSKIDIVSDVIAIPVSDLSFQNILCTEVLEHIPSPELAIEEFSRILQPGGRLIVTAPFCSQTHFAPYHFMTGFSRYWYDWVAKKYNFKILELSSYGNFFDYVAQEALRTPIMAVRYTGLGLFGNLLYLISIPTVLVLTFLSYFDRGSREQLCFGYRVIFEKNKS